MRVQTAIANSSDRAPDGVEIEDEAIGSLPPPDDRGAHRKAGVGVDTSIILHASVGCRATFKHDAATIDRRAALSSMTKAPTPKSGKASSGAAGLCWEPVATCGRG